MAEIKSGGGGTGCRKFVSQQIFAGNRVTKTSSTTVSQKAQIASVWEFGAFERDDKPWILGKYIWKWQKYIFDRWCPKPLN